MNRETIKVIAEIMMYGLGLPADQVYLANQNFRLPNDEKIYCVVNLLGIKPLSNNMYSVPVETGIQEVVEVQMQEQISIQIFSASGSIRAYIPRMMAALSSIYAQQRQEEEQFKIFLLPNSLVNSSIAVDPKMMNRYTMTILCNSWYKQTSDPPPAPKDYFDKFPLTLDDDISIETNKHLIEFEIQQEGD